MDRLIKEETLKQEFLTTFFSDEEAPIDPEEIWEWIKANPLDLLFMPKIAEEDKNEIIDLLSLFISYGRIHTVKGVSYFQGTHEEAINRAEKLRDKISNFSE